MTNYYKLTTYGLMTCLVIVLGMFISAVKNKIPLSSEEKITDAYVNCVDRASYMDGKEVKDCEDILPKTQFFAPPVQRNEPEPVKSLHQSFGVDVNGDCALVDPPCFTNFDRDTIKFK